MPPLKPATLQPTPELLQQYESQHFARIAAELRRLGISLDL
jgi:hypothetical protein